jgi:hypothetical protein
MPKLEQVFGISVKPVLSYIERPDVDGRFISAINGPHHIVIYGASKQGKTALRQKHLAEDRCITYRCGLKSLTSSIYQSILRDAGVKLEISDTRTDSVKAGAKSLINFKAKLPFIGGASASGELSGEGTKTASTTMSFVEADLGDAQMVGSILREAKFDKFIVLENFHYLDQSVQRELAIDLKTFHEMSIRFVVLGVWRESNRLFIDNPDLQDRVAEIPVEPWSDHDFDRVISAGEAQLKVEVAMLGSCRNS